MSGFKVNFSVNNQLATPSMHAAALANRPAAGQPGRVFIDTDNPSTGIYRDTGTIWIQIGAGAGALNLQNVTDNGNSTTNNILLQYPDNAQDNALVFYNSDLAQEEYLIRKRATGILTNDVLSIESRGNISPSTDPVGLLIDGSQNVIRSFFGTSYSTTGLKLDFNNAVYEIGVNNFGVTVDYNSGISYVGDYLGLWLNGTTISIDANNNIIKTFNVAGDIGLNLDLANGEYELGDFNNIYNGTTLLIDDNNSTIKSSYGGGDIGLKLDFANDQMYITTSNSQIDLISSQFRVAIGGVDNCIQGGSSSNFDVLLGDITGAVNNTVFFVDVFSSTIKTQYSGNDIGLYLDFANDKYTLGSTTEYIGIDPTNNTLIAGANLLSGSAGGSSGQHLKINVNGTNYKIKLENP
jgi:hypothetical protein